MDNQKKCPFKIHISDYKVYLSIKNLESIYDINYQ
jgi:hypothetical protein